MSVPVLTDQKGRVTLYKHGKHSDLANKFSGTNVKKQGMSTAQSQM